MISVFLVLLCGLLSFQFFTITTRMNIVNRLVVGLPMSLFESSIPLVDESENSTLFFDKEVLESNVQAYFQEYVAQYLKEFTLSYYYYNQADESYCTATQCDAVQVSVEARVILTFQYHRTMFYEIKDMGR